MKRRILPLKIPSEKYFWLLIFAFFIFCPFQIILGLSLKPYNYWAFKGIFLVDKFIIVGGIFFIFFFRLVRAYHTRPHSFTKWVEFCFPTQAERWLVFSLVIFLFWSLASALVNKVRVEVALFGTFNYLKYPLSFFIFAGLRTSREYLSKLWKVLLLLVLGLILIALVQNLCVLFLPKFTPFWANIMPLYKQFRGGIYRSPSLVGHVNLVGMYTALFFTVSLGIYLKRKMKWSWVILSILYGGLLLSISRVAIVVAVLGCLCVFIYKLRSCQWKQMAITFAGLSLAGVFLLQIATDAPLFWKSPVSGPEVPSSKVSAPEVSVPSSRKQLDYRSYTQAKAMKVWYDHPIFGVGPGMFGSHVSVRFNSPVYEQYGFQQPYTDYLKFVGTIEQEWLMLLAELGLGGMILFLFILATFCLIALWCVKGTKNAFHQGLGWGLMGMPIVIVIYGVAYTVTNNSFFFVTYCALLGLLVRAVHEGSVSKKTQIN